MVYRQSPHIGSSLDHQLHLPMSERHKRVQKKVPKILQANLGRGQAKHDLALALAQAENIDVLLLQKPWIFHNSEKRITKIHHDFEVFIPTDL